MAGQCLMQEIALYELFFFSLLKTGSFGLSARMEIFFSKTAWNLIRQTYPKVDYAGIVRNKFNIPNPSHSIIAWMALNSGLQQIELADFIPTNTVTLCGLCMLEDESAEHLFSAAMQVIYYGRERNSRRHEGNPSCKQNVVLENLNTDGSVAIEAAAVRLVIARDFIGLFGLSGRRLSGEIF
ncbi:unnamed protein product (mitochondrion) [Arabidopsis thaliana]|uniref:(thale cress) hypothetical protein n=1 Tax=Arabidopsis thaliana TaxID=3702 RepID=A0A7G2FQR0_ARATH|nr:unnamed protein product [Arabidopsis thaliana]